MLTNYTTAAQTPRLGRPPAGHVTAIVVFDQPAHDCCRRHRKGETMKYKMLTLSIQCLSLSEFDSYSDPVSPYHLTVAHQQHISKQSTLIMSETVSIMGKCFSRIVCVRSTIYRL